MPTRLSALLPLPLVFLLAGCPVWGSSNAAGPCVAHGDCSTGALCDEDTGACVGTPTCTSDAQCAANEYCDHRGSCVPDAVGSCRSDSDCNASEVCVEGSCHTVGAETCQFDLECAAGQRCVDNKCTYTCTGNAGCGSGEICTDGLCVVDPTECVTSDDCSGSQHCVEGRCLSACTSDADCSDPQDACNVADGFCRPDWQQTNFCDADSDCAAGSVCELATGICRIACDASSSLVTMYSSNPNPSCSDPTADCACQARSVIFPTCGLPGGADDYCRTMAEAVSDCERASDCTSGQSCVNGSCE